MNKNILISLLIVCFSSGFAAAQTNRYWVGASIYRNSLTAAGDLADWTLTNDNGSGSWTNSGTGSSILKVDNTAGGNANQLNNTSGGSPRLLMLDPNFGAVELQILALSAGTQFAILAEEYDPFNTLISLDTLLSWQTTAGFYTINLDDYDNGFDPSAKIRFIIAGRNTTALQGTIELNYFNYYNTNNGWSQAANWSATSGGTGGASVPTSIDNVFFDGNSASNAIIDVPVSINNITLLSTFKSGLINAGSNNFTAAGNSTLSGGFMVGVNDHLFVNNVTVSGTEFISTSGTITVSGTLTYVSGVFNPSNGTIVFMSSSAQVVPAIPFNNLTLSGTGAKTATGNFTVAGNFVNNSTFNANGNTVTFNGSSTSAQVISGSSTTVFNNITISNISTSGITLSSPVQLTGVLTLQANTKLFTNNNLTLIATSPTVSASIAALTTSAMITGNVKVQKYIYSSLRIYRYLSSPVSGATVADWQSSIPITGTFSNPSTGTGIVSTSPSMYQYDESVSGLKANGYTAYPASGPSSSAPLTVGKGYSVYVRNNTGRPTVLEVNGTINRGPLIIPLSYTNTGAPAEDGWNLVGNPFPSSISWASVTSGDRVNVANAIYYLDNNSASPVYRSWVGTTSTGTNAANGVISVGQAFWVTTTGSAPTLRFREAQKSILTPSFYRTASNSLLRISLDSTLSTFRDETVIQLADEATIDFDSEYDAYKLYDTGHPAIGSATQTSPLLSINALSQTFNSSDTIALFVQVVEEGNYVLSVPEYSFDASTTAYLWDTYINTKHQLTEGSTYPFIVSADSVSKTNRFKIILRDQSLSTNVFTSSSRNGMTLFPNPVDQSRAVTIRCPEAKSVPADIEVYDVTGTLVYSEEQVQGTNAEYPFTLPMDLSSGLYNIRIQTGGVAASSTVIIK